MHSITKKSLNLLRRAAEKERSRTRTKSRDLKYSAHITPGDEATRTPRTAAADGLSCPPRRARPPSPRATSSPSRDPDPHGSASNEAGRLAQADSHCRQHQAKDRPLAEEGDSGEHSSPSPGSERLSVEWDDNPIDTTTTSCSEDEEGSSAADG